MKSSSSPAKKSATRIGIAFYPTDKVRKALQNKDRKFLSYFTPHEKAYCLEKRRAAESFAARFAAKDAFWSALDISNPLKKFVSADWRSIGVERKRPGPPTLAVKPSLLKKLGLPKDARFLISITHERAFAMTVVMVEY